jgi:hypothetical protein
MYVPAQLFYNDEVWLLLIGMRLNQEQSSGFTRCGLLWGRHSSFESGWIALTATVAFFAAQVAALQPLNCRSMHHQSGVAGKKDALWFVLTVYTRFHSWRLNFTHTIHDSRASYLQMDLLWIPTFFQVCASGIHMFDKACHLLAISPIDAQHVQRPLHGIHFLCIHCRLHIRSNYLISSF